MSGSVVLKKVSWDKGYVVKDEDGLLLVESVYCLARRCFFGHVLEAIHFGGNSPHLWNL